MRHPEREKRDGARSAKGGMAYSVRKGLNFWENTVY